MTDTGEIVDVIDEAMESDEESDNEEELTRLRHLLARSRQEHSEQIEKLREQRKHIESLEAKINDSEEEHEAELEMLRSEISTIQDESSHKLELQDVRIRALEMDSAAMSDMEKEMNILRERVSGLLGELETQGRNHAEETHRLTKESFSLRVKLEQAFRKALQEMDGKYKEEAFSQLSRDSKNALVENSKLEEELTIQSIGIESLLERYKTQSQILQKVKQDSDLHRHEETLRLDQLRKLKQERMSSEARVSHLQRNVERLSKLRQEFERSQSELKSAREDLEKERTARTKESTRAEKWKARAFALSKQMLEISSVPPLHDDSVETRNTRLGANNGSSSSSSSISSSRHSSRRDVPEARAPLSRQSIKGGTTMMWSASANMDWKGGAGVGVQMPGMDPPGMQRVRGAGPGKTTLLKRKPPQSLPTLLGPRLKSRGRPGRDGSVPML